MLAETAGTASTSLDFMISGSTAPSTFGAGAVHDQSGLIFSPQAHALPRTRIYTYVAVSSTRQVIKGPAVMCQSPSSCPAAPGRCPALSQPYWSEPQEGAAPREPACSFWRSCVAASGLQISANKELFPDSGVRLHATAVVCRVWKSVNHGVHHLSTSRFSHQASAAERMLGPREAAVLQAPRFKIRTDWLGFLWNGLWWTGEGSLSSKSTKDSSVLVEAVGGDILDAYKQVKYLNSLCLCLSCLSCQWTQTLTCIM